MQEIAANLSHSSTQVRLSFTTKDESIKLPDGTSAILVASSFKRYQLSTLINQLLGNEVSVPFEFLVNGRFLRTSLDDFLTANGLSSEVNVSVEYVRASIPPSQSSSFQHDDWVSAVDVLSSTSSAAVRVGGAEAVLVGDSRILSAGYDGILKLWSTSTAAKLLASSASTSDSTLPQAIKAAAFLSPTKIASGGDDRIVRIWSLKEAPNDKKLKLEPKVELVGHKSSVDSIAVHAPSCRILSASSDCSVNLWSSRASEGSEPLEGLLPSKAASKRRRLGKEFASITRKGPLSTLSAHSRPLSQVLFDTNDRTIGYSCSWDQSIVTWDLTTSTAVTTRRTMHPLLSLLHLSDLNLLGAGTSARHVTMVDARADARDISGLTLRGHTGPVSALFAEPRKAWGVVSASFDGTCRVWDLRSVRLESSATKLMTGGNSQICESLYVIKSPKADKVLTVCWDEEVGIVSGGADHKVQIHQTHR